MNQDDMPRDHEVLVDAVAQDDLQAKAEAAQRERSERLRRGYKWLGAVILAGVLVGLMIGRLVNPVPPLAKAPVVVPTPVPAQVLDVLVQEDPDALALQLSLDRSITYQRTEEDGAVSLRLPNMLLVGGPRQGKVQGKARSLSWRVEQRGADVQVLLVALGEGLVVRDHLEPAGERWALWVDIPLDAPAPAVEEPLDLDNLPPAEAVSEPVEPPLPDWATAPVPAVDTLSQARESLMEGDFPRAIQTLEALHEADANDPDILRLLAHAYLADGQQARVVAWLPEQLKRLPDDPGLRALLARAQLQSGDVSGAVTTLEQSTPPLAQAPVYYALLAFAYQRAGQWRESADLYRRMVELRPTQASWQMGLGTALEKLDQPRQAARHYRLALKGEGLDERSREVARQRAAALEGRRP